MILTWLARLRRQPARRPERARCVLRLELLEDRTLPATINWIAGSGDFSVGSNWSGGAVPGPNDVAVIDTGSTAARITLQPGENIQVQAINTANPDELFFADPFSGSAAALTVTSGISTLNGPLFMNGPASLTANGSGVSLTANGTTTLRVVTLLASGGAQLSLPTVTSYDYPGTLQASGAGSTLTLGALTSLGAPNAGPTVNAVQGGQLQLPALTTINSTGGQINLSADGTGSTINVSAVTTYTGNLGTLSVTNGGAVLASALTTLNRVNLNLDGTGTLAISQWTAYTNGQATISGGTQTFTNLANINGAGFLVSGTAQVSLPAVTSINSNQSATIAADAGGHVQLPALTTIQASVNLRAHGTGSTLNVSALTSYNGGTFTVTNGGTVLAGALTKLDFVDPILDSTGTLAVSQWTDFTNGTATISGGTKTFNNLTQIVGAGFAVSGGAQVSLPAVTTYTLSRAYRSLQASGSGSTLTLGALTSIASAANNGVFSIVALEGGQVQLPALSTINISNGGQGSSAAVLSADGAGSTISMSALNTFNGGGGTFKFGNPSNISVTRGGTLLVGALTNLTLIGYVMLDGTGTFNASGPINLNGVAFSWAFNGATPTGSTLAIINATGGVMGTFRNLPEGATVNAPNGARFSISYQANGGKTVLLTQIQQGVVISSFNPTFGAAGTVVTITGTKFSGALGVAFGGVFAPAFTVNSDTQITVTAPGGVKTGPITVNTPSGTGTSSTNFTVGQLPSEFIVTGADAGGGPDVKVFDAATRQPLFNFFPYDQNFTGGVRVAVGDVNADSIPDIICAAGPGGGPNVVVFSGANHAILYNFFAYDQNFTGGVFVAAGDVNGDGFADIICGADAGGGPNVTVFSGKNRSPLLSYFPYNPGFTGGVRVGAGDVNGDGQAEIITGAGRGGGPNVTVYQFRNGQAAVLQSYFAYNQNFTAGIYVSSGDVNGDGKADVIVGAGAGGGPNVAVFDGVTGVELSSFFPYDPAFSGGVRVAGVVTSVGGKALVASTPGPGGGPDVRIVDGLNGRQIDEFFAYDQRFTGGLYVAATAA